MASLGPATTPGAYRANLGTIRHEQVILTNVTLSDCLRFAFGITKGPQIAGAWIRDRDVRFDIDARRPRDAH